MKVLNIATGLSCAADGNSTAVDLAASARRTPFLSNNTVIAAISLNGVADAIVTIQTSDDATFATGVTAAAVVDLTAAAATNRTVFLEVALKDQYIRVNANEVTTGAGDVSVDLLGN